MMMRNVVRGYGVAAMLAAGVVLVQTAQAQEKPAKITVDSQTIVSPVSPMFYGLMTEEINHSYEGGLWPQLLSNRTFRSSWMGAEGWSVVQLGDARAAVSEDKTTGPSAALPTSLKLTVSDAPAGSSAGLVNGGWWGIAVRPHTKYAGDIWLKATDGAGPLTAELISDDTGAVLAKADIAVSGSAWAEYKFTLATSEVANVSTRNHFRITVPHAGTVWFQAVTLMPPTFGDRPNGNRTDLIEKMAAMHPHFIRLPGGNYLEGDTLKDWYDWKKTIGPLVDRPGHQAPWSYWSTDGFGLLEFLEWCEDLKVEPVLAVYAGYSLHGGKEKVTEPKELEPYIQAAIDEVEYVTGDVTTKWGAERAKDGHPAPFPLHYIEIGNEDNLDRSGSYEQRYPQFAKALRKAYGTKYKLIATAHLKSVPAGDEPDLIDDHYYKSPADMFAMYHHYDDAPRDGAKIFVGEWATRSGTPTPNFGDALGDASLMTSMERNSDLIVMAAYAPLLVNVNPGAMQWATDLIGYNAMTSYGSPSWYAQCLFGAHIGDGKPKSSIDGGGERFFYSATVDSKTHVLHLKLVNASNAPQAVALDIAGVKAGEAKVWSLHAGSYEATNSIDRPDAIKPSESAVSTAALAKHTVPALTIQVIDVPVK